MTTTEQPTPDNPVETCPRCDSLKLELASKQEIIRREAADWAEIDDLLEAAGIVMDDPAGRKCHEEAVTELIGQRDALIAKNAELKAAINKAHDKLSEIEVLDYRSVILDKVEESMAILDQCDTQTREKEFKDALQLIAEWGGKTTDCELGVSCNGGWCAEQARRALDQKEA